MITSTASAPKELVPSAPDQSVQAEAARLAAIQLGQLADRLTQIEKDQVQNLLEQLVPLRQAREQANRWELSPQEEDLVAQLNQLYQDLTQRYLEEPQEPVEFTETVYHEYAHYLTLNDHQATYGGPKRYDCYGENDMTSNQGSYLNAFYQRFWKDYLDDRLADPESDNFYPRHEDDFITSYAATSPAEDIAESFSYFVLYDKPAGTAVWEQKQSFFYDYPELVAFRDQARARLGL